jgi:glycerol kinase
MSTGRGHIARAVAEGIAASVALLAEAAAADLGGPLTALRVDGGLTRSRVLLQAQADLLQVPVLVSRTPDATALGVAALARLALGTAGSPPAELELTVYPVITRDQAAQRLSHYRHALASTLS